MRKAVIVSYGVTTTIVAPPGGMPVDITPFHDIFTMSMGPA